MSDFEPPQGVAGNVGRPVETFEGSSNRPVGSSQEEPSVGALLVDLSMAVSGGKIMRL